MMDNSRRAAVLDLSSRRLTTWPPEIAQLAHLQELDLSGNQLTVLPPEIAELTRLQKLDLSGNQLTVLPPEIARLTGLRVLDLSGNRLSVLPRGIVRLTGLRILNLSGNRLSVLPPEIPQLTGLEILDLNGNQLASVPVEITQLTNLQTLGLSDNHLVSVPVEITHLINLQALALGGNQLTGLPPGITQLTNLHTLILGSNQLNPLPCEIRELTSLQTLDLSNNQLTEFPSEIMRLASLKWLYFDNNQLTVLPPEIAQLSNLTTLHLNDNQLISLPPAIAQVTRLETLLLANNRLTTLPSELAPLLKRGLTLDLLGNPLLDPLPELIGRGSDALATYLANLDDVVSQFEAKILLIGEGNVGKTSLVASLRGDPFVANRETTHGIEIRPLILRHPIQNVDMTIRTWDFGGQEVYRITHQFFFSRRALYLVVWNCREGQEQNEVEGWLRRIRLRVGAECRVIVVARHCDERHPELDFPQLQQMLPGMLVGQCAVDNLSGNGIDELRNTIASEAARLPQMGQLLSRRWLAARQEIGDLAKAEPQISYEKFVTACERHNVTGDEIVTLANLLHDLGQIIYYGDDEGLRDLVVLNPEWLTKGIDRVLEDQTTRQAQGILDHTRLKDIWQEQSDGTGYPIRYHPYFLRLMEKFDVSYRMEDAEDRSLVAQLVPYNRPELSWDASTPAPDGIRAISLVCKLSEPAPGLVAWLTVRHHNASIGKHWRRGVFLRHPIAEYASEALLELRTDNRQLAIEVRAPSPDMFFNVVRDSVEHLMRKRWPGLEYELLIPCTGQHPDGSSCNEKFPLYGLTRYRQLGETRHRCFRCLTDLDISRLLTGFSVPEPTLRPELERLHQKISDVSQNIERIRHFSADTADSVRKVIKALAAEVTDCPRLFTLAPEDPKGLKRLRFYEQYYSLSLWCEHPGHWHTWPAATYQFHQQKSWLVEVAPYCRLALKTLRVAVPVVAAVASIELTREQFERTKHEIELMKTLVDKLPERIGEGERDVNTNESQQTRLSPAEGQALRSFRALLFRIDRMRNFGGLRRVQAPAGEFLWVCTNHYHEYDPGLPKIPT